MKRRTFLNTGSAALGAAAAFGATATPVAHAAGHGGKRQHSPLGKVQAEFITFDDPIEEFEAHFRFERDLVEEEGSALSWYYWLAYAVPGDRPAIPVVRFEGIEYSYFRKVAENTYRIHAHNLSYPRSLLTNEFDQNAINPVTGKPIVVEPTVLLNDPGTVHSPKGFRNLSGDGSYVKPYLQFRKEDNKLVLDNVRTMPPNWPANHLESSAIWVENELFEDKTITNLLYDTAGMYIFDYPKWMDMEGQPGHMIGFFDGRKIAGIHELPDEFRAKAEAEHPDLLEPQMWMFDRPAPFEY